MRRTVLLLTLALALGGCRRALLGQAAGGAGNARADTAKVLEAVWRAAAGTDERVAWLYLPDADAASLTASEAVRGVLARRGVPVSARLPAGHDTVVYRVHRWTRDSTGTPVLELHSEWTRASANAPGGCIVAGNTETFRLARTPDGWEAERTGPILHGIAYCGSSGRRP